MITEPKFKIAGTPAHIAMSIDSPLTVEMKVEVSTNTEEDASLLYTVTDLTAVDPAYEYNQKGDYEAVVQHLVNDCKALTPDGLVATYLAAEVFSIVFAENITTSYDVSDLRRMADTVMDIVFDSLMEEDRP